jgi:hypothetical protein
VDGIELTPLDTAILLSVSTGVPRPLLAVDRSQRADKARSSRETQTKITQLCSRNQRHESSRKDAKTQKRKTRADLRQR